MSGSFIGAKGMMTTVVYQSRLPLGDFYLLPIIWFAVGILLGVWGCRDAESRGLRGLFWFVVMLVGGIIGLILYLVVRKGK
jgi:hypothetical protein